MFRNHFLYGQKRSRIRLDRNNSGNNAAIRMNSEKHLLLHNVNSLSGFLSWTLDWWKQHLIHGCFVSIWVIWSVHYCASSFLQPIQRVARNKLCPADFMRCVTSKIKCGTSQVGLIEMPLCAALSNYWHIPRFLRYWGDWDWDWDCCGKFESSGRFPEDQ